MMTYLRKNEGYGLCDCCKIKKTNMILQFGVRENSSQIYICKDCITALSSLLQGMHQVLVDEEHS